MKVLVTGSNGFIAKNLLVFLSEVKDKNIEIVTFDREDEFSVVEKNIDSIDIIYHFAGVNRPEDVKEFYEGNTDLTISLIDLLNNKNKNIPFVYSSSIQAELDNDYGKSKKEAEDYIIKNYKKYYIYRFHNVFGKWCRPNYNSVVATFCNNIANNLEITINDPAKEIELIYIDDICYEMINILNGNEPTKKVGDCCYIEPVKKISLQELVDFLYSFKSNMESIYVPKTGDEFIKKLFATFVSYLPVEKMVTNAKKNTDDRGSFTELVRTIDSGQFSISTSKPGVIRGNHYHNTKMERFIVVKGKAKITFKHVVTGEIHEFYVSEEKIEPVMIPPGYSHKIENIGSDEMILMLWCNELFDENKPDTYFKEII